MPLICKFCNYEFQRSCHNHQVLKECTKKGSSNDAFHVCIKAQ